MFAFRTVKLAVTKAFQSRNNSIGAALQNNVWQKSTINYFTYIAIACIGAEAVYGYVTNSIWETVNRGVSAK
jgi:hypothetical protein